MRKPYRKKLTDEEYNLIGTITTRSHLDESFDVTVNRKGQDCFYDFDERRYISLHQGLLLLEDGIAYPLSHEGLSQEEAQVVVNLFRDFKIGDEETYKWLMEEETA